MNNVKYLKLFDLPEQYDLEQLKTAYKKCLKKYHPDLNPNLPNATQIIQEVNAGYQILLKSVNVFKSKIDPNRNVPIFYRNGVIGPGPTMGTFACEIFLPRDAFKSGAILYVNFGDAQEFRFNVPKTDNPKALESNIIYNYATKVTVKLGVENDYGRSRNY